MRKRRRTRKRSFPKSSSRRRKRNQSRAASRSARAPATAPATAGGARSRRRRSSTPRPTRSIRRAATSSPPSARRRPRHHPSNDQRASRRRQHAGRENPVAVPRRLAGFRRQRPPPRPQRPRQSAISHQWRDAARRPDRLRQHSRRQLDRQHRPGGRRAPGRIRPANGRAGRHHDPRRHFQQQRSSQHLRRQSRNAHADDPIRRHVRQHLSDDTGTGSRNQRVAQRGLLSRRPVLFHRTLSANQRRPRKFDRPPTARSTTSRNRRRASPICRRSSTPIRGSA